MCRIGHMTRRATPGSSRHALALLQSVLDLFVCGNIAADLSNRVGIGSARPCLPRNLTFRGWGTVGGRSRYSLYLSSRPCARAAGAIEVGQVVWVYECPCLSGSGRRPRCCALNLAIPEVALEARCLQVETPDAQFRSVEGQLQSIVAFRERRLLSPPLGE